MMTDGKAVGRKDDTGKAPWGLLMGGCAVGLAGVVDVLKMGAAKYAADSWKTVPGGPARYRDALYRHLHAIEMQGDLSRDAESGLLEWSHVAVNALFLATFAAEAIKENAASCSNISTPKQQ